MSYELSQRRPRLLWTAGIAAVAAGGLVVAGCGASSPYSKSATNMPASSTTTPGVPVTVAAGSSRLGQVVVDSAGNTLYRFDKDTAGAGSSACNGACAVTWPAAVVMGQPSSGPGLAGTVGVLTRSDGTSQVTLDGHPLYRYAGDKTPGDTNGDGIGGVWHAELAGAAAGARSSSAGTSGY